MRSATVRTRVRPMSMFLLCRRSQWASQSARVWGAAFGEADTGVGGAGRGAGLSRTPALGDDRRMSNPTVTLYGIPNCDTVKRARVWLDEHGQAYAFHDFKKQGVPADQLDRWMAAAGWERVLNRQGTTWRKLDDGLKAGVTDAASARAVMLEHASTIKRPVVDWGDRITVGFDAPAWAAGLET